MKNAAVVDGRLKLKEEGLVRYMQMLWRTSYSVAACDVQNSWGWERATGPLKTERGWGEVGPAMSFSALLAGTLRLSD